jgi:hypothetical protein
MPDLLQPVAFAPELLDEVRDFDCGEEPYQKELAAWLLQDAIPALARGTRVWLYANQMNEVVGYGSLGLTRWKYPGADSPRTGLIIIPAVAIRRAFWGKPEGARSRLFGPERCQWSRGQLADIRIGCIKDSEGPDTPELLIQPHPGRRAALPPSARGRGRGTLAGHATAPRAGRAGLIHFLGLLRPELDNLAPHRSAHSRPRR